MKTISFIFLLSIASFNLSAAFTEPEMSQLAEINKKSIAKTEMGRKYLDDRVNVAIKNRPKEKNQLIDLRNSWDATIRKKCKLVISESLNTDAEVAEENLCLYSEYKSAADFFEGLNY